MPCYDRIAYGASRPSNGGNPGDTTCRIGTLIEQPSGHHRVAVVILNLSRKPSARSVTGLATNPASPAPSLPYRVLNRAVTRWSRVTASSLLLSPSRQRRLLS